MNIEYIHSYLAICKYKSLSRAARSLYVSQPTLTNRMNQLENYLGIKLFERSWKGIQLTESGITFLPHALSLIDKLEMFKSVKSNPENHSSVSPTPHGVTKKFKIGVNRQLLNFGETIINCLMQKFPDLDIDITTGSTKDLKARLQYGALDYIFYFSLDSTLPNTTKFKQEELVVILNDNDYVTLKNNIQLINKLNKPLYINENPIQSSGFLPLYNKIKRIFRISDTILVENEKLISILIQANKGYTILPLSMYHYYFRQDYLRKIHIPKSNLQLSIYSSFNKENEMYKMISKYLNDSLSTKLGVHHR